MSIEDNEKQDGKRKGSSLFKPGQIANPNGRKPGVANRITSQMRETMHDFFLNNIEKIQEDYDSMSSKDRLIFLTKLFPFFMPSLTATKSEVNVKHTGAEHLGTQQLHELILKLSTTTTTTTNIIEAEYDED